MTNYETTNPEAMLSIFELDKLNRSRSKRMNFGNWLLDPVNKIKLAILTFVVRMPLNLSRTSSRDDF